MTECRPRRFRSQVEPHLALLYRTALRLTGKRQDAEDLVQDTCLQVWSNPPPERGSDHLDRWLLRVLFNRFIDESRRRKRSPVQPLHDAEDPADVACSADPGPEELAVSDESERNLDLAWQQLERPQRVLLALRAEGHGLDEISDITGISRDVLRARLHRARRSLARHLQDLESLAATGTRAGSGG